MSRGGEGQRNGKAEGRADLPAPNLPGMAEILAGRDLLVGGLERVGYSPALTPDGLRTLLALLIDVRACTDEAELRLLFPRRPTEARRGS